MRQRNSPLSIESSTCAAPAPFCYLTGVSQQVPCPKSPPTLRVHPPKAHTAVFAPTKVTLFSLFPSTNSSTSSYRSLRIIAIIIPCASIFSAPSTQTKPSDVLFLPPRLALFSTDSHTFSRFPVLSVAQPNQTAPSFRSAALHSLTDWSPPIVRLRG